MLKTNNNGKLSVIRRKGIVEFIFKAISITFAQIISKISVFFLVSRGYDVSSSVKFRKGNYIFQSTKGGIVIQDDCEIGSGTRLFSGIKGKIKIGKNSKIYDYSYIDSQEEISIGNNTLIAPFCYIIDYDHVFSKLKKKVEREKYKTQPVRIGDSVWIGAHSVILKGVRIGNGAIIGASSVVTKDIPSYSIAVGNPARVIDKVE